MDAVEAAHLEHHDGPRARALLDSICEVYADAYEVEFPGEKVDAFRVRAMHAFEAPGFDLVTAHVEGAFVGFVFGYGLQQSAWWEGLEPEPSPGFVDEDGSRTVVLSEIEVRKAWQRQGLGRLLEQAFISGRPEERATLATSTEAASQHVYPRWGWQKVGRLPGNPGAYFSAYWGFVKPLGPSEGGQPEAV